MEKNQRIKYGSLIADMRRIRHITQRELASLSGVSYANISRIELGKYSPGLDVIQRIEDALEIGVSPTFTTNVTLRLYFHRNIHKLNL